MARLSMTVAAAGSSCSGTSKPLTPSAGTEGDVTVTGGSVADCANSGPARLASRAATARGTGDGFATTFSFNVEWQVGLLRRLVAPARSVGRHRKLASLREDYLSQ